MDTFKFVKTYVWAYKNGKSNIDVAAKLDVDLQRVYARANYLRKHGVKLPVLNRGQRQSSTSVEDLNSYIEAMVA